MRLDALFPAATFAPDARARDVAGLTADSRAVQAGFVFFAVPGVKADGLAYAAQAARAGAVAVVSQTAVPGLPGHVANIVVSDARAALAQAASLLYPLQPATIVAVTGTSGKTSVAAFARQIWMKLGFKAASIGTIGIISPTGNVYGSLTTPDTVSLHMTLDALAREGVTHVALEASSHGLDQRRLDGVRLAAGAFTNLSRDHLDYHSTFEDYFAAKMRLFAQLLPAGAGAVIDADGGWAGKVEALARARGLAVSTTGEQGATLRLARATPAGDATLLDIVHDGASHEIKLPLVGAFQAANALVAAGLCIATGAAARDVFAALAALEGAPGRLERVAEKNGAPILVDYAHKPDALEKALAALRPYARGKLIVVFGCGGDRDPGKRPIMGEIATRLADVVIVTDDNPRSEEPARIRAAIIAAAPAAIEIGDRGRAIAHGIAMTGPGDVLVIAGKGHETGQVVGGRTLPFSDHDAVRAALKERAA